MRDIVKGFMYLVGAVLVTILSALLVISLENSKGDDTVVYIQGKAYYKKVQWVGGSVYQIDYFPVDSLPAK